MILVNNIKTIDECMEYFKESLDYMNDSEICNILVSDHSSFILDVLKYETNKPSVYDLLIINSANYLLTNRGIRTRYHLSHINDILEIYKKREN